MKTFLSILFSIVCLSTFGQIIIVPTQYSTVQSAIDNAESGDTILILPGTYTENLVLDKPLSFSSNYILSGNESDIENTIINGGGASSVFRMENILTDTLRFYGLTVTNGNGYPADPYADDLVMPYGGGFYIDTVHAVLIEKCRIVENHLTSEHNSGGGMFCNFATLKIRDCEISDNSVNGGSFLGEGAGMFLFNSEVYIDFCNFNRNISDETYGKGGAIFAHDCDFWIEDSNFIENENRDGGAIYLENSDIHAQNLVVENNTAMFGSGVYVYNSVVKPVFMNNISVTGNGSLSNNQYGALNLIRCSGTVSNSTISDNESGYYSGGINISYSDLIFQNIDVKNNTSSSGIGGHGAGMYIYDSNVEVYESDIMENVASGDGNFDEGGGIYVESSYLLLHHVNISQNTAALGGAIYSSDSDVRLEKCLVSKNECSKGGVIYSWGSNIALLQSTTADNSATEGACMYLWETDLVTVNSILWNIGDYEIYCHQNEDINNIVIDHSNIQNALNGVFQSVASNFLYNTGNINSESNFTNPELDDYTLAEESPCIDAGTDYFQFNTEIWIDYNSDDYIGEAPDMGAFESDFGTSTKEFKNTNIQVFPNPTANNLNINSLGSEILTVKVSDISGKQLKTIENISNNFINIDVSDLISGIYILEISSKTETYKMKFVKE